MPEILRPLDPLGLCTNLVNQRIQHYRLASFSDVDEELPDLLNSIVAEAANHLVVWDEYLTIMRRDKSKDKVLLDLLPRVDTVINQE